MGSIPIGVNACLLGDKVRFDGQHQRNSYIVDTLSRWFERLGVPRESMRLEGDPAWCMVAE